MRTTTLALPALLLATTVAQAQSGDASGWFVGATQDFTRQSNVFNVPEGLAETASTVSTTSLRGGVNARLGRQRVHASALAFHQRHGGASVLNNSGWNIGAGLDWETVGRLSGSFAANSDRRLADRTSGIGTIETNTQRSDSVEAKARLGGDAILGLEAAAGHRRVLFSAAEFASRQYKQDNGSIGASWRPSGALTLGIGAAGKRTRYLAPVLGRATPDANRRRDGYLSAEWVASGASVFNARVNIGKTEYDQDTALDFEGATGSASWIWKPSGLLAVTTTLARDTGQDIGFQRQTDGTSAQNGTNFSRVTDTLALSAEYQLTGKVVLSTVLSTSHRKLVDLATASEGSDTTNRVALGARWQATRVLQIGCRAERSARSASGGGSYDYSNDSLGCYASATLD